MNQRSAISKINKEGALLVFPIHNRPQPNSLWAEFFPKRKLRWEWDESGDNKVGEMWMLMKRLSDCRQVVYSKWYQGRATFFSRDLFTAMLRIMKAETSDLHRGLGFEARNLFEVLESDSPLSTKELKRAAELQGKDNESSYNRGMKELFGRLVVIAFGEVEDGAFPSLAVGATHLIYEDLWMESDDLAQENAMVTLNRYMPEGTLFRKYFDRQKSLLNTK